MEEQDLGTIFRYCSLNFPFKILSYGFFLIRRKCSFLVKYMTKF